VTGKVILEVEASVWTTQLGGTANAVNEVSFELAERSSWRGGRVGCGKSTLLFAIARLLTRPPRSVGQVLFSGQNMVAMSDKALRTLRWRAFRW